MFGTVSNANVERMPRYVNYICWPAYATHELDYNTRVTCSHQKTSACYTSAAKQKKGRVRSGTHYEMVRTETVNAVQTSDTLQNNRAGGRRPGLDYFSTLVDDVELVRKRGPV